MGDFSDPIDRIADRAREKLDRVIRAAALTLFSRIVTRTPVDTGRARANWQIELDAMPDKTSLNERDKSGAATIGKIAARLGDVDKNTRAICLANNLVYIKPLEYGHSKRAPNGMVRLTAAEWDNIVRNSATERS